MSWFACGDYWTAPTGRIVDNVTDKISLGENKGV